MDENRVKTVDSRGQLSKWHLLANLTMDHAGCIYPRRTHSHPILLCLHFQAFSLSIRNITSDHDFIVIFLLYRAKIENISFRLYFTMIFVHIIQRFQSISGRGVCMGIVMLPSYWKCLFSRADLSLCLLYLMLNHECAWILYTYYSRLGGYVAISTSYRCCLDIIFKL